MGDAELGLNGNSGCRKGLVWGRGGKDDEVDVLWRHAGVVECSTGSVSAHRRGKLAVGGDPASKSAGSPPTASLPRRWALTLPVLHSTTPAWRQRTSTSSSLPPRPQTRPFLQPLLPFRPSSASPMVPPSTCRPSA